MSIKLISWNLNGIRACAEKGLRESISGLNPDIISIQETKADSEIVSKLCKELFPDYNLYCSSAIKAGYSGVATLVKKNKDPGFESHHTDICIESFNSQQKKLSEFFKDEGRFSILRSKSFTHINVYVPSGTSGDERQDLKMQFLDLFYEFIKDEFKRQKNIILCGDFNICHQDIDIHHPQQATKRKLTGFLPEERAWISKLLNMSFTDCYRLIYPHQADIYSWWSYRARARAKNLGWRIDYFFCSQSLNKSIINANIHKGIEGSDHCPVSLEINRLLSY